MPCCFSVLNTVRNKTATKKLVMIIFWTGRSRFDLHFTIALCLTFTRA